MENHHHWSSMQYVIIIVMIAACLTFEPQVVGRSNVYNLRTIGRQKHQYKMYFRKNQEEEEIDLRFNKTKKRIKMPRYLRIHDEPFKWPLIDITPSLKRHHHLPRDSCSISRFFDTFQLLQSVLIIRPHPIGY